MVMMLHVLLVFFGWLAHPFHVSVCDIEVNQKNRSLEISQRIFLDDLEMALRKKSGWEKLDVLNPSDPKRFDALMKDYIRDHLDISVNGKTRAYTYLGHEQEGDALWCYMEVKEVEQIDLIEVKNTILLETYNDQINLVHIKNDGKIRSLKLYQDKVRDSISYN